MPGTGRASIKSRIVRITALDGIGRPLAGDCASLVTAGYTNIAVSHEFEDGEEFTQKNAWGEFCVNDKDPDRLKNAGVSVEFCNVHADVLTMMASMVPLMSGAATVGAAMTETISEGGFAIETWTKITPTTGGPGGEQLWLYWVFPFLRPGRLSDFTMEQGPLLITVESTTQASNEWDEGPYPTEANPILSYGLVLPEGTHWGYVETEVQPPEPTAGCVAMPAPTPLATGATAGTPGTFQPEGNRAPSDKAELDTITPSPATAWLPGEYVLAGGAQYHWDGDSWMAGAVPQPAGPATGASAGSPGAWTPPGSVPPADAAEAITDGVSASPNTAWTVGQYVQGGTVGVGGEMFWDGTTWQAGRAT